MEFAFLAAAVFLTSLSQVLQKLGVQRAGPATGASAGLRLALRRPETRLGIVALAAATLMWLAVLARVDVGKAYPCLSFGYVVVLVVSKFYLGEDVTPARWLGVALIVAGIALVAQS